MCTIYVALCILYSSARNGRLSPGSYVSSAVRRDAVVKLATTLRLFLFQLVHFPSSTKRPASEVPPCVYIYYSLRDSVNQHDRSYNNNVIILFNATPTRSHNIIICYYVLYSYSKRFIV